MNSRIWVIGSFMLEDSTLDDFRPARFNLPPPSDAVRCSERLRVDEWTESISEVEMSPFANEYMEEVD